MKLTAKYSFFVLTGLLLAVLCGAYFYAESWMKKLQDGVQFNEHHFRLVNPDWSLKGNLHIDTVVYSGHGPATTVGEEKRFNPYLAPIAREFG